MYPAKGKRRSNPQIRRKGSDGFKDGLNTLPHPSSLKDTELSELINGVYSQYGSISKRPGTVLFGQTATDATKILNLGVAYNVNTTNPVTRYIRISDNGKPEYYNFTTLQWVYLSGTAPDGYTGSTPTFTDGVPTFDTDSTTWFVQLENKIIFSNETDNLCYLEDGQWYVYTALNNPTAKPTVAKTGSETGTTTHYYFYVWYNEAGGTLASPSADPDTDANGQGYYTNMPPILDEDTYLTVTLPTAPAGCTRVGVFKSDRAGVGYFLTSVDPSVTTYVDNGSDVENTFGPLPDNNDSGGQHFKLLEVYDGRLVGVSTEFGDEQIVYAGNPLLGKASAFSFPDGAGFTPYRKGEGTKIRAMKAHVASNEKSLFVFKDNCFGKFQIGEAGAVQDVNIAVGSLSKFSPHIAGNNLRFWSRDGAASVGNEADYGNILRYSVLSLRANAYSEAVTPQNLPNVCGAYYKNLSIFGLSTDVAGSSNNAALVYDERYNSWAYWTGIYASMFAKVIDPLTSVESLYYGSGKTADVVKMFEGRTDYGTTGSNGTPITLSLTTKQYDIGLPDQFKKYDKMTIVFGNLVGNNTTVGVIRADDRTIYNDARLRISTDATLSGFGNDEWSLQEVGSMTEEDAGSKVNIGFINLRQRDLFWVKLNIQNNGITDDVTILGVFVYYAQSGKQLSHRLRIRELA